MTRANHLARAGADTAGADTAGPDTAGADATAASAGGADTAGADTAGSDATAASAGGAAPRRAAGRTADAPTAPRASPAAGTARDRAKADRRAALLAAAARLFAERGFDGVTLGDIGEAAGVSGPAVYRHVSSKQALLGEILIDVSERLSTGGRSVADDLAARSAVSAPVPDGPEPQPAARSAAHAHARSSEPDLAASVPDAPPPSAEHHRAASAPNTPAHGTVPRHDPSPPGTGPHVGAASAASGILAALVDFHVAFALAEADVIRVQDRDLDRLSPAHRRTVRDLQNAYVAVWTDALAAAFPDAESTAERRVRALACFGLINSTPHSVRGLPASRVRPVLMRMALSALTA